MKAPHRRCRPTLRLRLLAAAGLLAVIAMLGAGTGIWGIRATHTLIEADDAAELRLRALSQLSARVGEFAVVAIEAAGPADPGGGALDPAERQARLDTRAELVAEAFERVEAALAEDVAAARAGTETEQVRRASRSLGLARMKANFAVLLRELRATDDPVLLRSLLDGFASRFSPLMNQAIEQDSRTRDRIGTEIDRLGRLLPRLGGALALAAVLALAGFAALLVGPLLRRLDQTAAAAAAIGTEAVVPPGTAPAPAPRLPAGQRDELGRVILAIDRAAGRVRRGSAAVARDRARLESIVAARTAELQEANARLARADQERRRFFADVGHELRTPLTVILAECELGTGTPPTEAEARAAFGIIAARARRLSRRIEDLLRIARSESGRIALEIAPCRPGRILTDAIEDMTPPARRAGITLDSHCPPGLVIAADADWLRQVLSGLIENALRHAPAGSTVTLEAGARDGQARIHVTDGGSGVPEADRARIFERHARGSRPEGRGFGVGLALARWVMERHDGGIDIESPAPGHDRGTRVTLWLPLAEEVAPLSGDRGQGLPGPETGAARGVTRAPPHGAAQEERARAPVGNDGTDSGKRTDD